MRTFPGPILQGLAVFCRPRAIFGTLVEEKTPKANVTEMAFPTVREELKDLLGNIFEGGVRDFNFFLKVVGLVSLKAVFLVSVCCLNRVVWNAK